MKRYILIALLTVVLLPCGAEGASRGKFSFLESVFRHSPDVVQLGRKSKTALNAAEKGALIKKYPRLAKSGDDMLAGIAYVEKIVAKSPPAGRMIEKGVNPARVAAVAGRSPETIKTGEGIAEAFSSGAIKMGVRDLKDLPAPATRALRQMEGNYAEAADAFLTMTRRGGQKAVDVAGRLMNHVNMKNAASATALGLLAWHMQDPEGCEQAVESFFKEHVAPFAAAPMKGLADAAGESLNRTFESASDNVGKLAAAHWLWLIVIALALIFWRIPNARKLPFNLLNSMFGKLNSKLESPAPPAARGGGNLAGGDAETGGCRVNVYKR
ncbi:MAG: hypothetical protein K2O70_10200 [Desulfovibrionaceae bacterium]|nr:hypothetical protein [Desulfovibrionaceae bacterium]